MLVAGKYVAHETFASWLKHLLMRAVALVLPAVF